MVLLSVSVIVLLLPMISLHFLKIYESALIRQTESELISQTAFIGAAYKNEISSMLQEKRQAAYGKKVPGRARDNDYFHPIPESIDLAKDPILPIRPDGQKAINAPAPFARQAGIAILPILKEAQRTTLSGMKVLDYQGIQVSGQRENGLSFAHLTEVRQALQGKHASVLRKRPMDGRLVPELFSFNRAASINVFVATPVMLNNRLIGVALVNRTPSNLTQSLYDKRLDIASSAIMVLLVTLGIAGLTSYAISRPIYRLILQARLIARGDPRGQQPIAHPTTREIALLSENLASMAQTIEHRSEYIRQFAMHVSHEFKTPLTAIQGSVELLQEHLDEMPEEQRKRFLNNIAQDTDRLRRLVSRLLELARADVLQPVSEPTDILPLIQRLTERYQDFNLQIAFENKTGRDAVPAAIAPEALETILTNLLDNSIQHGASQVEISLEAAPLRPLPKAAGRVTQNGAERLTLHLADNGSGISDANRAKLFTPFFTTKRDKGGTGLGLSIVQSLLQTCGGDITAEPSAQGALFKMTLLSG
jgi:signal transduction histidine kinase